MKPGWTVLGILVAMLSVGCASSRPAVVFSEPVAAPDSLKVKATFLAYNADGSTEKLNAVLFIVPDQRYRLELGGTMGVGVASLLWMPDQWTMVLPTEERWLSGKGPVLALAGTNIGDIDVHALAGMFWGRLLPAAAGHGQKSEVDSQHLLNWEEGSTRYTAKMAANGWPEEYLATNPDGSSIEVQFGTPTRMGAYTVPSEIRWLRNGAPFLTVTQKSLDDKATWSAGIWKLPIPAGWKRWEQ